MISRDKRVSTPPGKAMSWFLKLEPKYQLLDIDPNIVPPGKEIAHGKRQSWWTPDSIAWVTWAKVLLVVETNNTENPGREQITLPQF